MRRCWLRSLLANNSKELERGSLNGSPRGNYFTRVLWQSRVIRGAQTSADPRSFIIAVETRLEVRSLPFSGVIHESNRIIKLLRKTGGTRDEKVSSGLNCQSSRVRRRNEKRKKGEPLSPLQSLSQIIGRQQQSISTAIT